MVEGEEQAAGRGGRFREEASRQAAAAATAASEGRARLAADAIDFRRACGRAGGRDSRLKRCTWPRLGGHRPEGRDDSERAQLACKISCSARRIYMTSICASLACVPAGRAVDLVLPRRLAGCDEVARGRSSNSSARARARWLGLTRAPLLPLPLLLLQPVDALPSLEPSSPNQPPYSLSPTHHPLSHTNPPPHTSPHPPHLHQQLCLAAEREARDSARAAPSVTARCGPPPFLVVDLIVGPRWSLAAARLTPWLSLPIDPGRSCVTTSRASPSLRSAVWHAVAVSSGSLASSTRRPGVSSRSSSRVRLPPLPPAVALSLSSSEASR